MPQGNSSLPHPVEAIKGEQLSDNNHVAPKALPNRQRSRGKDINVVPDSTPAAPVVISPLGDIILNYTAISSGRSHYWQVSSKRLMLGSPYFGAMLDSDKFMEGRLLAQQRQALVDRMATGAVENPPSDNESSMLAMLPVVQIPVSAKSELCGVEAIQLFLKILCFDFSETEEVQDAIHYDLRAQSSTMVVKVIDLAEWFNSTKPIQTALRAAQYRGGVKSRPSSSVKVFTLDMLKLKERRLREMILISTFLGLDDISKAMTHTLIILGSKYWLHGLERPMIEEYPNWKYLPNGLEEELFYRRQCVLNTLTDLQAHFLRSYGGLESDEPIPKRKTTLGAAFSSRNLELQCRNGLDNGMQCDIFHLGQMTRFFALRTKTIFLGSTLVDGNSYIDESDEAPEQPAGPKDDGAYEEPQFAIDQVIASLKQYPDYQIDNNHIGCGIRRRILPILDGLEKFTADNRGLLGIQANLWNSSERRKQIAWSDKQGPKDHTVYIQFSKILKIDVPLHGPLRTNLSPEEQARFMFTAAKYQWET